RHAEDAAGQKEDINDSEIALRSAVLLSDRATCPDRHLPLLRPALLRTAGSPTSARLQCLSLDECRSSSFAGKAPLPCSVGRAMSPPAAGPSATWKTAGRHRHNGGT